MVLSSTRYYVISPFCQTLELKKYFTSEALQRICHSKNLADETIAYKLIYIRRILENI